MTEPTETARELLWRHQLPEDVIDGALALFAQELAGKIRARFDGSIIDDVREQDADLISPDNWARTNAPAGVAPATDQAEAAASCPGYETSPNLCRCPCDGCKHHCSAHDPEDVRNSEDATDQAAPELTAQEARDLADELSTQLYRAQDALAFVEECCVIADRKGHQPTTADVREWLKGARCGRQLAADAREQTALRDRIAEAIRRAPSKDLRADWNAPNGPLQITARVNDLADAVLAVLPATAEEHRLALSEALGLGTGAPWDAIHDRATELGLPPLGQDPVARRLGLLAEHRAAVLREAADVLWNHPRASATDSDFRGASDELRRVAADTGHDEAHPPHDSWLVEWRDEGGDWAVAYPTHDRSKALHRLERGRQDSPDWQWRLVRETTSYAVEAEQPAAAQQSKEARP